MFGTSIASFLFIICSSFFGMPISGTHTVVGGLIGAGLAAGCQIDWVQLGIIVAGWFVAPLVSMCFASLLYFTVCRLTLSQGVIALKWRFVWLTLIVALAAFLIFLMVIKLVDKSGEGFSTVSLILLGVAPVLGIFASRIVIFCFVKPRDGVPTG